MRGDIIENLLVNPHQFSLFQAVMLLQNSYPEASTVGQIGPDKNPSDEIIRFVNIASLSFPASQLKSIEKREVDGKEKYYFGVSDIGLYGIFSPLPLPYIADLVTFQKDEDKHAEVVKDFLDIFNHRIISLLCRVEEYKHVERSSKKQIGYYFLSSIKSFLGVHDIENTGNIESLNDILGNCVLNRYLIYNYRSADGLKSWLSGHLEDINIEINEFIPSWIDIQNDEKCFLGEHNCYLSTNPGADNIPLLGDRLLSLDTKFRISLGPVKWDQFIELLPGKNKYEKIINLVKLYVPDLLDFDMNVALLGRDCCNLMSILDGKTSQLGYTAGLYSENGSDEDLIINIDIAAA